MQRLNLKYVVFCAGFLLVSVNSLILAFVPSVYLEPKEIASDELKTGSHLDPEQKFTLYPSSFRSASTPIFGFHSLRTPLHVRPDLHPDFLYKKSPFQQEGIASWYGPGLYGRKTASGVRFQKEALTCAHKTLPFGMKLKITNKLNGKTVSVVVNDRGPYIGKRIVDLSYAAAREIGLLDSGIAQVQVEEHF